MDHVTIRPGPDGEVIGRVYLDGTLETDNDSLEEDFESVQVRDGVMYRTSRSEGERHVTTEQIFSTGDEDYLRAVAATLVNYTVETPDGDSLSSPSPDAAQLPLEDELEKLSDDQ